MEVNFVSCFPLWKAEVIGQFELRRRGLTCGPLDGRLLVDLLDNVWTELKDQALETNRQNTTETD